MKKEVYSIYNSVILTITSAFILFFWYLLSLIQLPDDMGIPKTIQFIIKTLLEYIGSFGFYKSMTFILHWLVKKIPFMKRIVLGNSYLDGIWIGYYIGMSGKIRYIVEHYEQNLDGIQINGESYTEDLRLHSTWKSTSANIISEKGMIIYTYEVEGCDENTNNLGCATLTFQRNSNQKSPKILRGFSIDVQFGKRLQNYERKLQKNEINDEHKYYEIAKEEFKNDPFNLMKKN